VSRLEEWKDGRGCSHGMYLAFQNKKTHTTAVNNTHSLYLKEMLNWLVHRLFNNTASTADVIQHQMK
jgi:hypothetical protein